MVSQEEIEALLEPIDGKCIEEYSQGEYGNIKMVASMR